jgi:flagellar biosynthesis protein FlhG
MNPQVWAFGGAKGGVGRSVLCASIAHVLASHGKKVIALDFDLGSANLHTLLGIIQPKRNLEQWILGQVHTLEDVCSPTTVDNLYLISGASSIYNPSHPSPDQLKRFIHEALSLEADYILIDLGSGVHPHTLDFFNVAGRSFIITTPEPTAIQNTYAFYKAALLRRLEVVIMQHPWLKKIVQRAALSKGSSRIKSFGHLLEMLKELDYEMSREVMTHLEGLQAPLIINRAYPDDERQVVDALQQICSQTLQFELKHTLTIPEDKALRSAIRQFIPLFELSPDSRFLKVIHEWVKHDLENSSYHPIQDSFLPLVGTPSFLSIHQSPEPKKDQPLLNQNELALKQAMDALPKPSEEIHNQHSSAQPGEARNWKDVAWPQEGGDPQAQERQYVQEPYEESTSLKIDFAHPTPLPQQPLSSDPPQHVVSSLEEELKTDLGWFHLKTVDLAPFKLSIRTSIYQSGERLVCYDESYEHLLSKGTYSEINKRVERLHYQTSQLLKEGGIESWQDAHLPS